MEFVKMQGLGNDFIVVTGPIELAPESIRTWCDRRRGVGADGVLEVTPIDPQTVRMRYWNADGNEAEMCGNGLRCVARYATERGMVDGADFVVETAVGLRPVSVNTDGSVRAYLGKPTSGEHLLFDGIEMHTVDIGNPHAIQWVDDLENAPVSALGPTIETADHFSNGTNVEFAAITDEDEIGLRVWERGVGETLACGTGAAATAFLAYQEGLVGERVAMQLRGGTLIVSLEDDGAWIEGPAETVFSGTI